MTDARAERAPRGIAGLDLHLELAGATRPARALESALRDAITGGRLAVGHRLPPSRALASDLGIARATVVDVYAQLVAEGWLETRVGAGTWVARGGPGSAGPGPSAAPAALARPAAGTLLGGLPDAGSFPRSEWLAATRRALQGATDAELGYAHAAGVPRLRHELAAYLQRTRGVAVAPAPAGAEAVLIGHGFGSLLGVLCRALAAAGAHRVAVEEFGHAQHRDVIRAAGLDTVTLTVDEQGAVVDELFEHPDVDAVLLTPAHQFPLGVPLAAERRRALVGWAGERGALIIEDDYDGEFRYDRRSIGALQGVAPDAVAYLGTASKALGPAVGLAWAVLPAPWRERALAERIGREQPRDVVNQLTLAEFLADHSYDRHVRRMRAEYRRRRALLAALLLARVPGARLAGVPAGLQATVRLPDRVDADAVVPAALRRGVSFGSLASYAADASVRHPSAVVIGYGATSRARAEAELAAAVAAIADVAG